MKALIFILLLIPVMTFSDHKPKQFEVTFKVTYNSITLERAAELEQAFRTLYKDACKVDVDVKKVDFRNAIYDVIQPTPTWYNLIDDSVSTDSLEVEVR